MSAARLVQMPIGVIDKEHSQYNSAGHSRTEIDAALPDIDPAIRKELAADYDDDLVDLATWMPCIAQSQHLSQDEYKCVLIPPLIRDSISSMYHRWNAQRYKAFSGSVWDELLDDWSSIKALQPINQLLGAGTRAQYFVRLEMCSAKDSPFMKELLSSGEERLIPITSTEQLLKVLSSSLRIFKALRDGASKLIVYPWREDFAVSKEFRVFVQPWNNAQPRISCISQYRWWATMHPSLQAIEPQDLADRLLVGCTIILQQMLAFAAHVIMANIIGSRTLEQQLTRVGLTFDVAMLQVEHSEEFQLQLVEPNPFGPASGTGACLYHWLRDHDQLYGINESMTSVEVRLVA